MAVNTAKVRANQEIRQVALNIVNPPDGFGIQFHVHRQSS